MGFESIEQPSRSSEVEHNPKSSISFLAQLCTHQSTEVAQNDLE